MPIDFARLAADATGPWLAASQRIASALGLLGPLLAQRLQRMATLELRSRSFPVFAFEGLALSVVIHPSQHGALRAYASTGAAFAAPFVAFGRGVAHVAQAVEDELLLPNFLNVAAAVVDRIAGSIERLIDPRPSTFDPRHAEFWDAFGVVAMAYRGLSTSTGQLRQLAGDIVSAVGLFRTDTGTPPAPGGAVLLTPAAPAMHAESGLDSAGHVLVAAIALIPAIPGWIGTLAEAAWLRGRVWLLDTLQGIEARAFDMRETVLRLFVVTLPALLRDVPALAMTLGAMLQRNIQYFAFFVALYFEEMLHSLELFFDELTAYVNAFVSIVNAVLGLLDRILHTDLLQYITPFIGPAGAALTALGITVTLDDLIDAAGAAANFVLHHTLKAAILTARGLIYAADLSLASLASLASPILGTLVLAPPRSPWLDKLDLLDQIVNALFRDTGGPMVETAASSITPMPNLYDLFFGASPASIASALSSFGTDLAAQVHGLFDNMADSLRGFGTVFSATATDIARTGPATRMPPCGRDASALANGLFDDQLRELGARTQATPARSFEQWLARGGFEIIGAAIPLYVAEMRRYWQAQAQAQAQAEGGPYIEITPTSPHILARRARLGRVRMPRLTLRTNGAPLTQDLARDIAERFQRAVREAFETGQARLQQIAASAG